MRGLNKVTLIGNIGKDPEIKYIDNNITLAKFSLATTEMHKDKAGNYTTHTEWHNIVLWRRLAEFAEKYLKKGNLVYIEGKIKTRTWEDANQVKRYATDIIAENVIMLEKRVDEKDVEIIEPVDLLDNSTDEEGLPF